MECAGLGGKTPYWASAFVKNRGAPTSHFRVHSGLKALTLLWALWCLHHRMALAVPGCPAAPTLCGSAVSSGQMRGAPGWGGSDTLSHKTQRAGAADAALGPAGCLRAATERSGAGGGRGHPAVWGSEPGACGIPGVLRAGS